MNPKIKNLIQELRKQSNNPICAYVYDLDGIQKHVLKMLKAMPAQTHLFYAIKANPDQKIIQTLLPFVKGFEVASIGELKKVRDISKTIPILFGGPAKKDYELEEAIKENVSCIHVESLFELNRLIMISKKINKNVQVLLRINLRTKTLPKTKISMGGRPTQFGIDENLIEDAISIMRNKENTHVHLRGFHFHSLSNNMKAELHIELVNHYIEKVTEWKNRYDLDIQVINAGGGFGVSYDQSPNFNWDVFTSLLRESKTIQALGKTQLFFEPGRFIVADYGYYVTEVVDIKRSQDRYFAVLRGGTHHNRLPVSWGHNHPFSILPIENWSYPFPRTEIKDTKVTLVGELCTPKDLLHDNAKVERLRVGDAVIFEKSGAYCWNISHHDFLSHPHPDFYYVTEEGIIQYDY